MANPLDVLAFAAHPDDVELCVGGTMCLLSDRGYKTGIVDLTRGERGSRGTPEGRLQEAQEAADILGVAARENLGLPDGDIRNTEENRLGVIRMLRKYRPRIVLVNPPDDRHPDHGAASRLVTDATFYAGLRKIETTDPTSSEPQEPFRPRHVLHYMQMVEFEPTFVVDVTSVWERRMEAIRAFKSQFHNPDYAAGEEEPQTFISSPDFLAFVGARARAYGYRAGFRYGEPLLYHHGPVPISDLAAVLGA